MALIEITDPQIDPIAQIGLAVRGAIAVCPTTGAELHTSHGRRMAGRPRRYVVLFPTGETYTGFNPARPDKLRWFNFQTTMVSSRTGLQRRHKPWLYRLGPLTIDQDTLAAAVLPVAYFYGRYTFTEEPAAVPIEGLVATMAQYPVRATEQMHEKTHGR